MSPVRGRRFRPSLGVVAVASIGVGQLAASAVAGSATLAGSPGAVLIVVAAVVVAPVLAGGLMWLDAAVVARERARAAACDETDRPAAHLRPALLSADFETEVDGASEVAPGRSASTRIVAHEGRGLVSEEPRRRVPAVDLGARQSVASGD